MDKRLIIGIVIVLGLGGAVFAAMGSRTSQTSVEKPTATLPAVKKDDITHVDITKPDKVVVGLDKQNGAWVLTSPVSAKADTSAVDALLDKLSDLEVDGVAATRKENHKRLGVDAETGIHVVAKAGDKPALDLWIGSSKSGGTMVRQEGKDEVLSVKGSIRYVFDKEVKLFRDRVVTDVEPKDFAKLTITSDKGAFTFEKAEDKWVQPKGQKAIEKFSDAKVQSLVSTLSRLRAADFAEPNDTEDAMGFAKPTATAVLTTKDGKVTTLVLGREHANTREYYLRVDGNPVVYRISKFTAERMTPEAKAFQEDEKKPDAPAPEAMGGMPGGDQQIPPEILKQLQQQMGGGGGMPPGHP